MGIFVLSAASLALEVTLTRVFSVAQWYHFAFMVVSVALLGFGASGSWLSLFPGLAAREPGRNISLFSLLFALSVLLAFWVVNTIPFDSYRIAWERIQVLYLVLYYVSLMVPFFFAGLAVATFLRAAPAHAWSVYAANLTGSATGCIIPVLALPVLGGSGVVLLSALLGSLACVMTWWPRRRIAYLLKGAGLCLSALIVALLWANPAWLDVRMAPYKGLSTTLRFPGAQIKFSKWNAFSRVDVVDSPGIHSLPGLSLAYRGPLPEQMGLFVDGDNLSPITRMAGDVWGTDTGFLDYLTVALPFQLRAGGQALIFEPLGGLDLSAALRQKMDSVTVVQSNALILETLQGDIGRYGGNIYRYPSVKPVIEAPRSFIEHSADRYDVVLISLSDTFHPITSGAYSLSENYLYTTEALAGAWRHLRPGGLLAVPRWLQLPPSESLRIMATALEALERAGVAHPASHVAMIRSWSTSLLLMGKDPLTATDLARIREFCQARQFDLVYYPGMAREETNRYNVLPEPYDYDAIQALLASSDRSSFYTAYPFDVRPATDNRPFFFHFFKWSQTPELLQNVGKVWQPFGGSGYFVVVALLLLALLASALFILVPLWVLPRAASVRQRAWRVFAFFGLLGLAYLFVEIPLLPKLVLFLGQPTYSFAAVLFALLLFSGVGSAISSRFSLRWVLPILGCLVLPYGWGLSWLLSHFMGYAIGWRVLLAVLSLAPLGLLMGMPFPRGIALVAKLHPDLISWVWAINACASVVSSTLAMILALSFGLNGVILAAGLCYLGCWLTILPLL